MIGDSIVYWASMQADQSDVTHDSVVRWCGFRGLTLARLPGKLKTLRHASSAPKWVIIHCGTNDLGSVPKGVLANTLRWVYSACQHIMPQTRVAWSDILPRQSYDNAVKQQAVNKVRRSINHLANRLMPCIPHWNISKTDEHLFRDDVHLSPPGIDIFKNNIYFFCDFLELFS